MTVKRIIMELLALAACCAIAVCTNPGGPARTADPSSALAIPVVERLDPDPQINDEEETPMEYVYKGILAELEEGPDGLSLVMVPLGTPAAEWGDYLRQFIFHTGKETRFCVPPEQLRPGMELQIRHNGISTRSLPPQGYALKVGRGKNAGGECRTN